MATSRLRIALFLTVACLVGNPASAYKRLRWGPFEVVPTMSLELRQHSNVYVTSDDAPPTPAKDVSGLIIDFRPGLSVVAKPRLEKRIKGLYFDFAYTPSLVFFPSAPTFEIPDPSNPVLTEEPDKFKFDHNLRLGLRYQANNSGRLSFFAGAELAHPELAQTSLHLDDFRYHVGTTIDFTRKMSLSARGGFQRFETPTYELVRVTGQAPELNQTKTPFGTYDDYHGQVDYDWEAQPTLILGSNYRYHDRQFRSTDFETGPGSGFGCSPNNFNCDTVPDNFKDYTEQTIIGRASKRLTHSARGNVHGGFTWRTHDERQFGAKEYSHWVAGFGIDSLLSRRTRLQLTGEYTVTDTYRPFTLTEFNAFTNDQTGQFTVLPEDFSVVYDQRYLVDLAQTVTRRGDQVLLGFAYQHDRLEDQIGSRNFLVPGTPLRRDLDDTVCEGVGAAGEPIHCQTVLSNRKQNLWLISAGYRFRLPDKWKFVGLQVRANYFNQDDTEVYTDAYRALVPNPPDPDTSHTSYWSINGGLVFNLQIFQ